MGGSQYRRVKECRDRETLRADLEQPVAGPEEAPEYRCSHDADPPISGEEARAAKTAVCPRHGGLIQFFRSPADQPVASVYWCPQGQMLWRLKRRQRYQVLHYGRRYL